MVINLKYDSYAYLDEMQWTRYYLMINKLMIKQENGTTKCGKSSALAIVMSVIVASADASIIQMTRFIAL